MPHRKKGRAKVEQAYRTTEARIRRWRTIIGALAVIPLGGSLSCEWGLVPQACGISRELYLGLWAAIFGAFLGLTIRLVLERRRFEQRSRAG